LSFDLLGAITSNKMQLGMNVLLFVMISGSGLQDALSSEVGTLGSVVVVSDTGDTDNTYGINGNEVLRTPILATLSGSKAIGCYNAQTSSPSKGHMICKVLNIDGLAITSGASLDVSSEAATYMALVQAGNTNAFACWSNSLSKAQCTYLTINGDGIAKGAAVALDPELGVGLAGEGLDATSSVLCYGHATSSSRLWLAKPKCRHLSVVSNQVTVGNALQMSTKGLKHNAVSAFSKSTLIHCGGYSNKPDCVHVTVSGTSLTKGATLTLDNQPTLRDVQVATLSSSTAVVCYTGQSMYSYCTYVVLTGTTLSRHTPLVSTTARVQPSWTAYMTISKMTERMFFGCYTASGSDTKTRCMRHQPALTNTTATLEQVGGYSSYLRLDGYTKAGNPFTTALTDDVMLVCFVDGDDPKPAMSCQVASYATTTTTTTFTTTTTTTTLWGTLCSDWKTEYKKQKCCDNPTKTFVRPGDSMETGGKSGRLLGTSKDDWLESVQAALDDAKAEGDPSEARKLAEQLVGIAQEYITVSV
jgi:hypothetical protein